MHATKNNLPLEARTELARLLNQRLADLIDLHSQAKQAHWNVKGPQFIALHQLFDGVAETVDEFVDTVAERVVALGGTAAGTIDVVASQSSLPRYSSELVGGRGHVDALSTSIAAAGERIRAAIDQAEHLGDAGTADLFTGISRELDKQLWFVESHLAG